MDFSLIFVCAIFQVTGGTRNIYYSNQQKSYKDAKICCQLINGTLLSYGQDVVKASAQCNMVGQAWLYPSWLKNEDNPKEYETLERTPDLLTVLNKQNQIIPLNFFCKVQEGVSTNLNISCSMPKEAPSTTPIRTSSKNTQSYTRNRMMVTHTSHISTSTTYTVANNGVRASKITDIPRPAFNSTEGPNMYPTLTNDNSSYNNDDIKPPKDHNLTVGVIAVLAATAVFAIILIIVGICYKQRVKRSQKESISAQDSETGRLQMETANYELPPALDTERDDNIVYDHTNHTLIRSDDTSGNIYDHSYSVEGVYDSAAIQNGTSGYSSDHGLLMAGKDSDNTYDHGLFMNDKDSNATDGHGSLMGDGHSRTIKNGKGKND